MAPAAPGAALLREVIHVRQVHGERRRRWFSSPAMDLVAWYGADDRIAAFQLCYDKLRGERAVTWSEDRDGLVHMAVDDGEAWPLKYKSTPILVPDGRRVPARVRERFRAIAVELPAELTELVLAKLAAG